MDWYRYLRPLLFNLEPETAHRLTLTALDLAARLGPVNPFKQCFPPQERQVMGLRFPNPVGLAAGLDKDGDHIPGLACLGFGFLEVGTVTPRPQPGNPAPRLFRIPQAEALINRMGFNNRGVDHMIQNLRSLPPRNYVLGVNLGKNKDTPQERAADDYLLGLEKIYPWADYVTVNLSSPNTPGLRDLQHGQALDDLLSRLHERRQHLAETHGKRLPIVVKIAPDLSQAQLAQQGETFLRHHMDGVIATNTTLDHGPVEHLPHGNEQGGLSGRPLFEKSTEVVKQLHQILGDRLPIIACGGILNAEQALAKFEAGASLVQVYSGLIYRGPSLIGEILAALRQP